MYPEKTNKQTKKQDKNGNATHSYMIILYKINRVEMKCSVRQIITIHKCSKVV